MRSGWAICCSVLMALMVSGCAAEQPAPVGDAVGGSLADVTSSAPDAGFLIQDASTRVGLSASFSLGTSSPDEWTVVAACADSEDLHEARNVEVAILPATSYPEVAGRVAAGEFRDLVSCDGLDHR
ncbi:hypothetical protein [Microbacterium sp. NPDC089695]|uniref:hypothetical protein n=1 Tax=Microbacterium sp. NPDC089695 TaxID=3364198 RepID=UPI003823F0F1